MHFKARYLCNFDSKDVFMGVAPTIIFCFTKNKDFSWLNLPAECLTVLSLHDGLMEITENK